MPPNTRASTLRYSLLDDVSLCHVKFLTLVGELGVTLLLKHHIWHCSVLRSRRNVVPRKSPSAAAAARLLKSRRPRTKRLSLCCCVLAIWRFPKPRWNVTWHVCLDKTHTTPSCSQRNNNKLRLTMVTQTNTVVDVVSSRCGRDSRHTHRIVGTCTV